MFINSNQSKGAFSRISNFFRGNSSSSQNILFKQSGEQEAWADKAVDILIKKLRKQGKQSLVDLEDALKSRNPQSKCVTIPRSMDGRLQVSFHFQFYRISLF